jgi:hypothetical protein
MSLKIKTKTKTKVLLRKISMLAIVISIFLIVSGCCTHIKENTRIYTPLKEAELTCDLLLNKYKDKEQAFKLARWYAAQLNLTMNFCIYPKGPGEPHGIILPGEKDSEKVQYPTPFVKPRPQRPHPDQMEK